MYARHKALTPVTAVIQLFPARYNTQNTCSDTLEMPNGNSTQYFLKQKKIAGQNHMTNYT